MRLYYSGAAAPGQPQPHPALSLGGYRSSSQVPGELLGNVFGALSATGLSQPQRADVRCLVLRNELATAITDLTLTLTAEAGDDEMATELFTYELGLQLPTQDEQQRPYFEQVPLPAASPLYTTFTTQTITLPEPLAPQAELGIWLRRRQRPRPATDLPVAASTHPATLAIAWE